MNKKGQALAVLLVVGVFIAIGLLAYYVFFVGAEPSTQRVVQQSAQDLAQATKSGDVASVGVYVRDISGNNINQKIAIPIYCQDDSGNFIIDATTSSTTAETTGKSTIGKTVTCWAFDSTHQTLTPVGIVIDEEAEHVVIDAYNVSVTGKLQFYDDTYTTGSNGVINITMGASVTDTFQKMRYTNNNTDRNIPLGGFYFDIIELSNVSTMDVSGSAVLSGMDHSSTNIVKSTLSTGVSARNTLWNFVFEIDDDAGASGNQPLLMEENDYLESGSVSLTADGDGCSGTSDKISSYAFTKGYYRSNTENSVKEGHESDATVPVVISADITGDTFWCNA